MNSKASYNPYKHTEFADAPPDYSSIAGPSGSAITVDLNTGLCRDQTSAPPSDPDAIRSIYGGISGINVLSEVDTVIVIDDSESMKNFGYWALVKMCLQYVGPVVTAYDPNGVTVYCLNARGPSKDNLAEGIAGYGWNDITSHTDIDEIFNKVKPMGTTPIYDRLLDILTPYINRVNKDPDNRPRPINVLVLTDGVADDTDGVEELIGEICGLLDENNAPANQVGIQFVQIGDLKVAETYIRANNEKPADQERLIAKAAEDLEASAAWLRKLDDYLVENSKKNNGPVTRDIVDTKSARSLLSEGGFTPKALVSLLVGAMSRRHDRMQSH